MGGQQGCGAGRPARQQAVNGIRQLGQVNRAMYQAIASTPTPALDEPLRRLSRAADKSRLWLTRRGYWLSSAALVAAAAAVRGVLAIGATSAVVNLAIKPLAYRARPDRAGAGVPGVRQVAMPGSTSFPSGHSASAFAFATALSRECPWVALGTGFRPPPWPTRGCTPGCTTRATP